MSGEIWLQTEQPDGSFQCESFTGVPVARPSWIVVVSAGSAEGHESVARLRAELSAVFRSSTPGASSAPRACPAQPPEMHAENWPNRRKLLALVGSTDAKISDRAWYAQWESDKHSAAVMTLLPPGNFEDFFVPEIADQPTHLLRRVNANRWKEKIAETVPGILARAEVTTADARAFISYRRLETLPIALQLFERLTAEGFEVFLDQFSIPPGYDFQRRLSQELEDKSMVLLLESKSAKESKWTQHEIDFVKRYRLGLFTLRMPDVEDKQALASVRPDTLKRLDRDADFVSAPRRVTERGRAFDEWPELKPDTLDRVVARLKRVNAQALFERRNRLRGDLVLELTKRGVHMQYSAAGPLIASAGGHQHLLWLTTRPPEVEDFRTTHEAHRARADARAGSLGIVIGPQAAQEPDRLARLGWLSEVSGCLSFDEGNLGAFADRLAQGNWK